MRRRVSNGALVRVVFFGGGGGSRGGGGSLSRNDRLLRGRSGHDRFSRGRYGGRGGNLARHLQRKGEKLDEERCERVPFR